MNATKPNATQSVSDPEQKKKKVKLFDAKSPSAYNLFYRYTRIVNQSSEQLDENPPSMYGLESVDIEPSPMLMMAPGDEIKAFRKSAIELVLRKSRDKEGAACAKQNKSTLNSQMNFTDLSQHVSNKWQEADEITKSIFRELARENGRENSERRRLAEFQLFKGASARFYIEPPIVEVVRHVTVDSVNETSVVNVDPRLDTEQPQSQSRERKNANRPISQVSSGDWTPLPFGDKADEMSIIEFHGMLSSFDWS